MDVYIQKITVTQFQWETIGQALGIILGTCQKLKDLTIIDYQQSKQPTELIGLEDTNLEHLTIEIFDFNINKVSLYADLIAKSLSTLKCLQLKGWTHQKILAALIPDGECCLEKLVLDCPIESDTFIKPLLFHAKTLKELCLLRDLSPKDAFQEAFTPSAKPTDFRTFNERFVMDHLSKFTALQHLELDLSCTVLPA